MNIEHALGLITHGDILLGIMHGLGLAPEVPPGKGTLYINARAIIENDEMPDRAEMPVTEVPARQETMGFYLLCENLDDLHPIRYQLLRGAMDWIGDPRCKSPSMTDSPVRCVGACIAEAVLQHQRKLENVILYRLMPSIIIDQTPVATMFLGDPPVDTPYCWLVLKTLANLLRAEGQIVHNFTQTYWWQQPEQLTDERHTLIDHPVLQRVANKMVTKAWLP
jgi:hypothetical protein